MYLSINKWPVTQDIGHDKIPADEILRHNFYGHVQIVDPPISYDSYRGKSYQFIVNLTARLLKIAKSHSFKVGDLTPDDLEQAESYIIKNSMKLMKEEFSKGKLQSLRAEENSDGIINLRSRALQGLQRCYETEDFPILTYNDPV